MYKYSDDNMEMVFINYKDENMELMEFYYDPILDKNYIYINGYLAYKYWKVNFKYLNITKIAKKLLTLSAKLYLEYINSNF